MNVKFYNVRKRADQVRKKKKKTNKKRKKKKKILSDSIQLEDQYEITSIHRNDIVNIRHRECSFRAKTKQRFCRAYLAEGNLQLKRLLLSLETTKETRHRHLPLSMP